MDKNPDTMAPYKFIRDLHAKGGADRNLAAELAEAACADMKLLGAPPNVIASAKAYMTGQ